MKKKIILLTSSFDGGGAEHFVVKLANGLQAFNENISIVALESKGPNRVKVNSKIKIIDIMLKGHFGKLFGLLKVLLKEKPDIVLTTQIYPSVLLLFLKIITFNSFKVVLRQASISNREECTEIKLTSKVLFKAFTTLVSKANAVVFTTNAMKDEFYNYNKIKLPKKNVFVIGNPIDFINKPLNSEIDSIKENCHPWFLLGVPILLYVGRLENVKRVDHVLKAFEVVSHKVDCRLLILGQGTLLPYLKEYALELNVNEKIDFVGYADDTLKYMRCSNLLLLTSYYEGFPNVLIEALSCQLPIVAYDVPGGIAEILGFGKFGSLAENSNINHLVELILEELSSEPNADLLLSRASDFSTERIVDQYIALFNKLES